MVELIICEKPTAARKVAKALSDKEVELKKKGKVSYYIIHRGRKKIYIASCVGHLYTLAQKDKKANYTFPVFDIGWSPSFEVNKDLDYVKAYIDVLDEISHEVKEFTVACDYDIEGEVIGLNALRFACHQKDANRMKFSTLTKGDLVEAYEKKEKTISWGLANAGETRHILDWYYGINLSRALTFSLKAVNVFKIMSIGRVQGPALKLIVDREREIIKFKPEKYWQLLLETKNKIEAMHKKGKFWDSKEVLKVYNKIKKEKKAIIKAIKKREYNENPPYPFDLTTLQTESHGLFRMSPKQTLAVAQKLYLRGLISYPRTSSQQLTPKIGFQKILKALSKQTKYAEFCKTLIDKGKDLKPNNGKKTDPAHPAIFPTGVRPKTLDAYEAKIYDLVVKRFLSTFGVAAKRLSLNLEIDVKGEIFHAEGRRTIEENWFKMYRPYVRIKDKELPKVKEGDILDISKLEKLEKETSPPKRYNESSLIKELESRNLGTKATRADIIDTLYKRAYVDGKKIQATDFGIKTIDTLEKYSPEILDEALTRSFQEDMEKIKERKIKQDTVIKRAKTSLNKTLDTFKEKKTAIGMDLLKAVKETQKKERTVGKCRVCKKGDLLIIKSKKTFKHFIACDRYPDCKTTYPLPQGCLIKHTDKECKECGFPVVQVIRKGKRAQNVCINTECPTKKKSNKTAIKQKCPVCGKDLILRKSFYGEFIGCTGYPKCRYTAKIEDKKTKKKKKSTKKTTKKTKKS